MWWRSVVVSALALINVVNRHWARLVLGVMHFGLNCTSQDNLSRHKSFGNSATADMIQGHVKVTQGQKVTEMPSE